MKLALKNKMSGPNNRFYILTTNDEENIKRRIKKITKIVFISAIFLSQPTIAYASKLFVSNNEGTISTNEAYKRMYGKEEHYLKYKTITTLQKYHYQIGRMHRLLGTYYMQADKKITADNTLLFVTSPKEEINKEKIIDTAAFLAKQFGQESVAIFINNGKLSNSDVIVRFNGVKPSYSDIKKKIPLLKSAGLSAFSIYFQGKKANLNGGKISAIEWLTTPDKYQFLRGAFKGAAINVKYGEALLVFKDGQTQPIT